MATFQDRVEDYVGTFSDTAALTAWLTESARKLIDLIPPEKALRWAKEATFTGGAGTSVHDSRVVAVYVSDRGARQVDPSLRNDFGETSSINYVTARDPVYYLYAGNVYTYPSAVDSARLLRLVYPTSVQWDDSVIADFPTELVEPVILDVASKAQLQLVRVSTTSMAETPFTLTDPLLSLTMNDAATIDLSTQYSAITTLFSAISTAATTITTYVDTSKDIELAEEKLRQVDRYLSTINGYVTDIGARLAEYKAEGEEESITYTNRLAGWKTERDAVVGKFMGDVQQETARIQSLSSQISQIYANFAMLRKMYVDSLRILLGVNV